MSIRPGRFGVVETLSIGIVALLAAIAIGQVPSPPADPLSTLNDDFRASYRRVKEQALVHSGPILLMVGDNVVLRRAGRRTEVSYTPPIYHVLKMVAHVPLAIDVILAPHGAEATLDDDILAELRHDRDQMERAIPKLDGCGLDPEQRARARRIFDDSRAFLDAVVKSRRCSHDDRIRFARRMTPVVMKNVDEAARAELDALHAQVSIWRSEMPADEWKTVRVVILGSAMPRKLSLYVQYFARLLGEPGEGPRIVYAESIRDEEHALDLLATGTVDTTIGVDFFNDPARMHRDLLSDAAAEYLPLLIDQP